MTEGNQIVVESDDGPVIDIDKPIVLVEARQKYTTIQEKTNITRTQFSF